jgi:hypothetical protein
VAVVVHTVAAQKRMAVTEALEVERLMVPLQWVLVTLVDTHLQKAMMGAKA